MPTVVIWDECGVQPIRYFVTEKEVRNLDRKYINSAETSEEDADSINDLVFQSLVAVPMLEEFPRRAVIDGAAVIVCGMLP